MERSCHHKSFHINKKEPLGRGSYGAVYKARCDQLPCVAKILHCVQPTIKDPKDPGARMIMEKFEQECIFLGSLRHPHIVQYLGMNNDLDSGLPVLFMELLDENLTKLLERSQEPLAHHAQVDLCHDISLAVSYLHSNDIIHRDLSSNNVLIIAGKRAKVTDYGVSRLAEIAPSVTPLTMCLGTSPYMPPETFREPPVYTKKLDCFSEGVIMIQVCTRIPPQPGPRTQLIQDSRNPTAGTVEAPVPETERRRNHIELITPSHPLQPIAVACLSYDEEERPSADQLCQKLTILKEKEEYVESVQRAEKQIVRETTVHRQEELKQLKDENRWLHERESQLQAEITSREEQFQWLNQELSEIKQTNTTLQMQLENLQKQLSLQVHIG